MATDNLLSRKVISLESRITTLSSEIFAMESRYNKLETMMKEMFPEQYALWKMKEKEND